MPKSVDIVNQSGRASDDSPLELIHTVMHQYRSRQYQVLRSGGHDITHMESKVLGYLSHHPQSTQSDLAKHSGRDKAQLARLIKALRERGLLDSAPDEADRRNLRLSVTPGGLALLQALHQQSAQLATQAVVGLTPAELAQLVSLLQRVRSNFETKV